jgi:hypothetical protein
MRPEERKIIGDIAEEIMTAVISGEPVRSGRLRSPPGDAAEAAGWRAREEALRRGSSLIMADSIAAMTDRLVYQCLTEMRRRSARGGEAVGVKRTAPDLIEIEFRGTDRRAGVPPLVKSEMAEMARAGFTAREIGEEYGFPEADARRILRSMRVEAPEPPPLPPEFGLTGIDATTELDVAEALMSGASIEEAALTCGVTPDQAEAVRVAWANASPAEAALDVIAQQQEQRTEIVRIDPIAAGEILFYQGAGPQGWRVEIAPPLADRVRRDLDDLRSVRVHGAPVTEYDILCSNIRRFADRNLPASNRRLKMFPWRGVLIREFKGFQGRVFFGTMKSSYPDGREIWRCGLAWVLLKKRDEATNADLEKIVDAINVWRAWRTDQDARIAEAMR